jgi:lipopolysaccharide transport system ATP-binding protein
MSRPAIVVDNLSKSYRLGVEARKADSVREAVAQALTSPLRRFRETGEAETDHSETFWALRDVSFEVQPGEVVGIIGRNGAGKSTLLKILSRIVEPTDGCIRLRGRIASLLEVGTGFHPELTGRENVYLNGSILGMKRAEIARNFDEIVAFAGVERFLDTPVKRYSSGMYVRLAFAVAAHLEPEILIIDEVLAVGDAEFQKKCLGKMKEISHGGGRTVLFVSHNILAVRSLCDRGLFLEDGRVVVDAPVEDAVAAYVGTVASSGASWVRPEEPRDDAVIYLAEIDVRNSQGVTASLLPTEEPIEFRVVVQANRDVEGAHVAVCVFNSDGSPVFTTASTDHEAASRVIGRGRHAYAVKVPARFLATGRYTLSVAINIPYVICFDSGENQVDFEIEDLDPQGARFRDARRGSVTPIFEWYETR